MKPSKNIVAIIEARMGSSRLPGKVLQPILGKPSLELLIERLQRSQYIEQIIVATSVNPADEVLATLARRLQVGCFRGSEADVLDRVLQAAQSVHAAVIVEITGDCPLIDPHVIDQSIEVYLANDYDFVSNNLRRTYPRGLDVDIFATQILEEVAELTQDPEDREHVSLYIYEHPERYKLHNVESGLPSKFWDLRLTLDTPEDLALIRSIYESLYPVNPEFTLTDVLCLLDQCPELLELNRHIPQKKVHGWCTEQR